MSIQRTRFDNGLTLIAEELHEAPVVALQAWVDVGSADEDDSTAGVAHLHEHMLFKGTERRGVGEIARTVETSGGEINAWTSFDQTVYHLVLSKDELHTGIDILADALRHSAFDASELAREIEVVCEEIRRADDAPARRLSRALFALAYEKHPYRRSVLGTAESVRGLSRERIVQFYREHYRPESTTLVVVGDFETAQLVEQVRAMFGDWTAPGERPSSQRPSETGAQTPRVEILREDVKEARLALCWHIPGVRHEDIPALDALAVILAHGESSRLQAQLRRRQGLVNDVYAYAYTPRDPGLLMIGAGFNPANLQPTFASLLAQLYGLRERLVSDEELEKAKVVILSDSAYQRETVQGQARKLGFYEVVAGDYAFEAAYRDRLRHLEPSDLRAAARRYCDAAPAVVAQLPEDAEEVSEAELAVQVDAAFAAARERTKRHRAAGPLGVSKVELEGGATLLVREEDSPVVAIRAVALGGLRYETRSTVGTGSLFASLWGLATEELDAMGLARAVDVLGGSLSAFSGRNTVGLRAEFIRERAAAGLKLFCDALTRPRFNGDDLDRERAVILERIRNRADNPAGVCFDTFAEMLFPTHPYGMRATGTEETVKAIDIEAIAAHRRRFVSPDKLVVAVVGGIDSEHAIDSLAEALDQPAGEDLGSAPRRDPPPARRDSRRVSLARQQAQVIVGGMGTTVDDPARFSLEVLTTILSGQSGRLFLDLRDKQSLAYSVSSGALEGLDPGHVLVHMGTSPEKVDKALAGVYGHLERLCEELVSDAELDRAQRYLVGTHAIDMQRCGSRAMLMALDERFGLGYADHTRYATRIRAVTAKDVQAAARRFLDPNRLLEVVVG